MRSPLEVYKLLGIPIINSAIFSSLFYVVFRTIHSIEEFFFLYIYIFIFSLLVAIYVKWFKANRAQQELFKLHLLNLANTVIAVILVWVIWGAGSLLLYGI